MLRIVNNLLRFRVVNVAKKTHHNAFRRDADDAEKMTATNWARDAADHCIMIEEPFADVFDEEEEVAKNSKHCTNQELKRELVRCTGNVVADNENDADEQTLHKCQSIVACSIDPARLETSPQPTNVGANGNSAGRTCPQLTLILITLFLLLTAMILATIAVMNPSWQTVDIREFQATHHHGLYTDCTRAERIMSSNRKLESFVDRSPLHCTYKFDQHAVDNIEAQIHDIDSNAAAAEAEHHQFHGWQKAVLIFIGLSLVSCTLAMIMGLCAPCTPGCAVLHSISSFFAFLFAVTAASIFFFAAHRVDSRFVQGLVGTYEQQIGEAFYCYLINCILLMLVFILSIIGAYHALRSSRAAEETTILMTREQMAPLAGSWMGHNGIVLDKTSV